MQIELLKWQKNTGWNKKPELAHATMVIYFGGKSPLSAGTAYQQLHEFYPKAQLMGCSTGGEIYNTDVMDDSIAAAAIRLDKTPVKTASVPIAEAKDSFAAGRQLAQLLDAPDLRYVLLLSDGIHVNGSDLIRGMYDVFPENVIVTGGLAGDGANFKDTLVGLNALPQDKLIVAAGFYGDSIRANYGSVGGWHPFGPERKITKSVNNVLYELDGRPALDLYKEYLGDASAQLPGSALLFPLAIKPDVKSEHSIVRTIVGVDEKEKTMIFAGDVPEGYTAQLMSGNATNLSDGATKAASLARGSLLADNSLGLLVSCIGRKLLMGQAVSDETEAVSDVFKNRLPVIGFYSYGEICPQQFTDKCALHNQTMTVTILHEQ